MVPAVGLTPAKPQTSEIVTGLGQRSAIKRRLWKARLVPSAIWNLLRQSRSACPDPDGHGFGQDLCRRQHRLSPAQVQSCPPHPVPGGPGQFRQADRRRVRQLRADDPRKFPTLYTVQRLKTNAINPGAKVVITTIQRLYSILKGDTEFDGTNEEGSGFDSAKPWQGESPEVV